MNLLMPPTTAASSSIEIPGRSSMSIRVTLEAGVTYQIDVAGHGGSCHWPIHSSRSSKKASALDEKRRRTQRIIREGGRRVASDDDSGDGMDRAACASRPETAGEYLIQVSGLSNNATGGYEVKIVRR